LAEKAVNGLPFLTYEAVSQLFDKSLALYP